MVDYKQGRDDLISVGDLLDRGPDPVGCVAFAMEKGARLVKGNHEEKALRWLKHEARAKTEPTYKNPMRPVWGERAAQWRALSEEQVAYLQAAPVMLDIPKLNLLIAHAGLEPLVPLNKQKPDRVTRVRFVDAAGEMVGYKNDSLDQPEGTCYWTDLWKGPQHVVYGHAVHSTTEARSTYEGGIWTFGIDTGCVFGGHLTAIILDGMGEPEFAQVRAKKNYYEWPKDAGPLPE
jgi:hypothetical protein